MGIHQAASPKSKILAMFRNPSRSVPHIHVCGLHESGVRECLDRIISSLETSNDKLANQDRNLKNVFVRINALYVQGNVKRFLGTLKEQLGQLLSANDAKFDALSDVPDIVRALNSKYKNTRLYLIISDADALTRFSATSLSAIFNIPKTCIAPSFVRIVTCSEAGWADIDHGESASAPVTITVYPPTKEECLQMIEKAAVGVPAGFVNVVVSTTFIHCNDVNKLLDKTFDAWNKYMSKPGRPVEPLNVMDAMKCVQEVVTDSLIHKLTSKYENSGAFDLPLPMSAKYLIVAAFCAGHNPVASDKRFFSKYHGKEQRSEAREKAADLAKDQHETDPRQFDVQRLTMIYNSLIRLYPPASEQGDAPANGDIHYQISAMVAMGLLQRVSSASNLDFPKYRCLITYENARSIAGSLPTFQLSDYLEIH